MQTRLFPRQLKHIIGLLAGCALLVPSAFAVSLPAGLDERDWQAISSQVAAQQQAAQFQAVPDARDDALVAANPVHGFTIRYSHAGYTEVTVAAADDETPVHRIALRPVALGYGNAMTPLTDPGTRTASGTRVDTRWDDQLSEWWVNSASGLEQWFELAAPPAGQGQGELRMTLALDSTLNAELASQGDAQHLLLHDGSTRVRFEKLLVEDANGQRLPAHMQLDGNQLAYVIDDRNAVYPLTIDPTFVQQQAYLKASNTGVGDYFGTSVAVSGDTVVVGAPGEGSFSGAAYVFVRTGSSWSQQAYLKASNTGAGDFFGWSVAISGDTLVVGANRENSNATGVDGDQSDNSANNSGAAYVFVRSGSTWSQQAYLKASNTDANDEFGWSVAISGDTVVVGAWGEDGNATGVNGDQSDNSASAAGAAYVFVRSGISWSQQVYLKASNTGVGDRFGHSVAVSGDTVVVGAYLEDSNATGANGDQSDNSASSAGAAYVFVRSGTSWSQQAYLKASNTEAFDSFGWSVAVSGDTVVVGARGEGSNATGVNGDQSDNSANNSGAAYVFVRSGSSWTQQAYLKASNTDPGDQFGSSVAISGDTLVVGARLEDSNATGVNGDQSNNSANNSGAAYAFVRSGTSWSQQAYLKASNTDAEDWFGSSVAISGDTVVIAAPEERSNATGVNGDQSDNSAPFSGAAYVFSGLGGAARAVTPVPGLGPFGLILLVVLLIVLFSWQRTRSIMG